MADLKTMTVRALRDLARKHVGPGYTKLKTKSELLSALSRVLPRSVLDVLEPGADSERAGQRAEPGPAGGEGMAEQAGAPARAEVPVAGAEPDPEGYLVSRIAGEDAARDASIPLVEEKVPPAPEDGQGAEAFDEQLGELPDTYGDDDVVLLPKGPRGLYLYWDLSSDTVRQAIERLRGLKTRIRLYVDDQLEREHDFALDSRSWYFNDLEPGHTYRVELVAVSKEGRSRVIGPSSNPMLLPGEGPSETVDDRFVRIPVELPAVRLAETARQAAEHKHAPGTAPASTAFPEESRETLYQLSGGAARTLGSSEQLPMAPDQTAAAGAAARAAAPGAPAPSSAGGRVLSGVRSSGPWPWSGTVPRRSS